MMANYYLNRCIPINRHGVCSISPEPTLIIIDTPKKIESKLQLQQGACYPT